MEFPIEQFFTDLNKYPFEPRSDNPLDWLGEKNQIIEEMRRRVVKEYGGGKNLEDALMDSDFFTSGYYRGPSLPQYFIIRYSDVGEIIAHPFGVVRLSTVGDGTTIHPFANISNSIIGQRAIIHPHANIENLIIDSDVLVRSFAEVKGSIIMRGAKISTGSNVLDAVVGSETRIAANVTLRNRLHTQKKFI